MEHIIRLHRRKTLLMRLVVVALLLSLLFWSMNLKTPSVYGAVPPDACFDFDSSSGTIIKYYDNENNDSAQAACPRAVNIPSQIAGASVLRVGIQAFRSEQISAVILPATLEYIGAQAFESNAITALSIPSSVTTIESGAFRANLIGTLTIADSVTSIGPAAFEHNLIASINIPSSLAVIPTNFLRNNRLTTVEIPSNITTIQNNAFASNRLTAITIPENIISLGTGVFQQNNITAFDWQTNIDTIPANTFWYNSIKNVVIPEGVTVIGASAFEYNYTESIDFPDSLRTLGGSSFARHRLTTLYIPDTITSMGMTVFGYGTLEHVRLSANSPDIPGNGFYGNNLISVDIPEGVQTIGGGAFWMNDIAEVVFPSTIREIGSRAFQANQLENVTFPETVAGGYIGTYAFTGNKINTVNIPQGLTLIFGYAFSSNRLEQLHIPASVTGIGTGAFAYNDIESLTFHPNASVSIDSQAFMSNRLKEVLFPTGMHNPNSRAFVMQSDYGRLTYGMIINGTPESAQSAFDSMWYTRIHLMNSTNSRNVVDGSWLESGYAGGTDFNQDGDTLDSLGGHIVNAHPVEVKYRDAGGNEIRPSETFTGLGLQTYLAAENETNNLALYYRKGGVYEFTAPHISGYSDPQPSYTQTVTVIGEGSDCIFVYESNRPVVTAKTVTYTKSSESEPRTVVSVIGNNFNYVESVYANSVTIYRDNQCSVERPSCYTVINNENLELILDYVPNETINIEVVTLSGDSADIEVEVANSVPNDQDQSGDIPGGGGDNPQDPGSPSSPVGADYPRTSTPGDNSSPTNGSTPRGDGEVDTLSPTGNNHLLISLIASVSTVTGLVMLIYQRAGGRKGV